MDHEQFVPHGCDGDRLSVEGAFGLFRHGPEERLQSIDTDVISLHIGKSWIEEVPDEAIGKERRRCIEIEL